MWGVTIKRMDKRVLVSMHIAGWMLYIAYIYCVNYFANPAIGFFSVLSFILPFCASFYGNLFCLQLIREKGIVWGVLAFLALFGVLAGLGYVYIYDFLPLLGLKLFESRKLHDFLQAAFLGYVQYFIYSLLYFFIRTFLIKERSLRLLQKEKFVLEQEKQTRELEKLQLEYSFLRSQINPHFLHNTLNILFSQAMEYSEELAENIMKLSQLMRYALESVEAEDGKVQIQHELQHLNTLIDIHQIRFSHALKIDLQVTGKVTGQMLPPLSIITAVENAFKYGDLKDPLHPLVIEVRLEQSGIYFRCQNKKKAVSLFDSGSSHTIGLNNLSKRLDIAFKDRYEIRAEDRDNFYSFELTIKN